LIRHKIEIAFLSKAIVACRVAIGFASGDGNSAPYYAFNLIYLHTSNGFTAVNSATVKSWSGLYLLPGRRPWTNDMNFAITLSYRLRVAGSTDDDMVLKQL
jgi:hypothetical protein